VSTTHSPLPNLRREKTFKPHAQAVLAAGLGGEAEFEALYQRLRDEEKDLLLGVASKYVFLVRDGDWHVSRDDCNPVIDYLTNSFKLVSLFSLIESLSNERHEDFHEWLQKRENASFPIQDKAALKVLCAEYKETYGSIRRFIRFFERLPASRQAELRGGFKIRGKPVPNIKKVAEFLYNLRSKFVHEGEFVLDVANVPVMSRHGNAETLTDISLAQLMTVFEEGLASHFRRAT
jgi:hypothetical protein